MVRNRGISRFVWTMLLCGPTASHAQQLSNIPRQDFWVTDGAVNAVAVTNNRVFIGGSFRYVGPFTGGGVPVDINTMQPVAKYPKVNGSVHAVVPDGQGGWFIGGEFTTVGGRARTNLAHITAAGDVDTNWIANATGPNLGCRVERLLLDDDTLYAVGSFTNLNGLPRYYAGAMNPSTGGVTDWAPHPETNVLAIAVSTNAVYLGGQFLSLNGVERRYVGAVDKTLGQVTAWNPWNSDVNPTMYYNFVTNSFCTALVVTNGWVIIPGAFRTGFAWVELAGFSEGDSSWITAWAVKDPGSGSGRVYDLQVRSNILYVAGSYSKIGGDGVGGAVPRENLAAIALSAGVPVTSWHPSYTQYGPVHSIAFQGNTVIAAGTLNAPNPYTGEGFRTNADNIVRLDLETGGVVGQIRPFNNGAMYAIASQGDEVYLGGAFDSIGGVQHEHLAELSLRDGSLQPWNPRPNYPVSALRIVNNRLLVGGSFYQLGDEPRSRLAAYDLATMSLTSWNPDVQPGTNQPTGPVIAEMMPHENSVFVAGEFVGMGGQPRSNLCKINLATGLPDDWRADANGRVDTIALAGCYLYAGGRFATLGNASRSCLGRIDVESGVVDDWAPEPGDRVTSLSANSNAIYASGWFTNVAGSVRRGTAAFAIGTGELLPWSLDTLEYSDDPPVGWPLVATDDLVYAAGIFDVTPSSRLLVAVDPVTATVSDWDSWPYSHLHLEALYWDGRRLYVTGERSPFIGQMERGFAVYEPRGFSQFAGLTKDPSGLLISVAADQGYQVVVEKSPDFSTWTSFSTNTAWEGVVRMQDAPTTSAQPAFYRAKTNPPQ